MELKRVVVTGLGALTPIGNTVNEYWEGLKAGKSGCGPITKFDAEKFRTRFACEIKDFKVEDFIPVKEARKMDPFTQYAVVASDEAIKDAGFDMDLGGKDIISVQYQNANNSVRVSDEFMRAYENSTEFGLKARSTGEVIETTDARKLFRKMAEAAWACADPGIQYDTTINDWHTNH